MDGTAVISHRYRCIFAKVPKCASTSMREWFIAHAAGRHSFRPFWYPGALTERMQALARALDLYPDYFAFSFVRNPYRRFLSIYRHASRIAAKNAARRPGHPGNLGTPEQYAQLVAELLDDSGALWGPRSSAWFRDNARRRYGPLGIPLYALKFTFGHARPQVDFLPDCHPERLMGVQRARPARLDFIGAVETVGEDFERLRERIGLPPAPLIHRNAAPAPRGAAPRCDPATARLVEQLYAADIAFTGCTSQDALPAPAVPDDAPGEGLPRGEGSAPRRGWPRGEGSAPRRGWPPGEGLASGGMKTRLRRLRYDLDTLEMAVEDRLFRTPAVRRRLRPRLRRFRGRD